MSDKPIPTLREILHTADGIKDRPLDERVEPEPRVDVEALLEVIADATRAVDGGGRVVINPVPIRAFFAARSAASEPTERTATPIDDAVRRIEEYVYAGGSAMGAGEILRTELRLTERVAFVAGCRARQPAPEPLRDGLGRPLSTAPEPKVPIEQRGEGPTVWDEIVAARKPAPEPSVGEQIVEAIRTRGRALASRIEPEPSDRDALLADIERLTKRAEHAELWAESSRKALDALGVPITRYTDSGCEVLMTAGERIGVLVAATATSPTSRRS